MSNLLRASLEVHVVPVSLNLGDVPYFEGTMVLIPGDQHTAIRRVCFHRDHIVDHFPLLYCPARMQDALEMNLFMEHRYRGRFLRPKSGGHQNPKGGVTVKTLKSIANSLRGYLAWLAKTNTNWREVYAVPNSDRAKTWLPPYRYQTYLISQIEAKLISRDTANLYLNHVRQFYEWAHKMQRIDRIPFQYKRVPIKKRRNDGDFDLLFNSLLDERALFVQTTDLVIPKKYKSKQASIDDGLTPYTSEELKLLFDSDYMQSDARRLWAQLAFMSGLRAMEVASFPEQAVVNLDQSDQCSFPAKIVGKFGKERTIMVPRSLMASLWRHKNSPERLKQASKWDQTHGTSSERPLFLNRAGQAINPGSITNLTSKVSTELGLRGIQFNRSFHDLRSTFATTLAVVMLEKNLPIGYMQYKLMSLLGHTNFSTTLKYVNFARFVPFEKQMEDWVSRIFAGLGEALSAEAIAATKGRA